MGLGGGGTWKTSYAGYLYFVPPSCCTSLSSSSTYPWYIQIKAHNEKEPKFYTKEQKDERKQDRKPLLFVGKGLAEGGIWCCWAKQLMIWELAKSTVTGDDDDDKANF